MWNTTRSVRHAGIRAARYLGAAAQGPRARGDRDIRFHAPVDPKLPRVAYVTQCQNQGTYSNTFLYGKEVSNLVPVSLFAHRGHGRLHRERQLRVALLQDSVLSPGEPARGHGALPKARQERSISSAWSSTEATTTPTSRSSALPTWPPRRCGGSARRAWSFPGKAAATRQRTRCSRSRPVRSGASRQWRSPSSSADPTAQRAFFSWTTCPEAKYLVSGGSIEKPTLIPKVKRVAGGDVLRLRKETGGEPEPADVERTLDNITPFYCGGNQSGIGRLAGVGY